MGGRRVETPDGVRLRECAIVSAAPQQSDLAEVAAVVEQVRSWPAERRVVLARRILETLSPPESAEPLPRGISLEEFRAMLPPIPDEFYEKDYKQILEEELCKKYCA